MKLKIQLTCKTLNQRQKGHRYFKYKIEFAGEVYKFMPCFIDCMHWASDVWGNSMNIDMHDRAEYLKFTHLCNPHWSWGDKNDLVIYLKDDEELATFKLYWIVN